MAGGKAAVVPEVSPEQRTILVEGLTPDITEEILEMYFEQPKYGGGEIEKITIESPKKARIVFRKPEGKIVKIRTQYKKLIAFKLGMFDDGSGVRPKTTWYQTLPVY